MHNNTTIELDKQVHILVGDTTIIATANYREDGENCFDKIANLLKEELENQSCS